MFAEMEFLRIPFTSTVQMCMLNWKNTKDTLLILESAFILYNIYMYISNTFLQNYKHLA